MKKLTSMTFFNRVSYEFAKFVKFVRFVVSIKFVESFEFELFELFGGFARGLCLATEQVQGALEYGL